TVARDDHVVSTNARGRTRLATGTMRIGLALGIAFARSAVHSVRARIVRVAGCVAGTTKQLRTINAVAVAVAVAVTRRSRAAHVRVLAAREGGYQQAAETQCDGVPCS